MATTIQGWIQIKCPNLFADTNLNTWIEGAVLHIDPECYGDKYNLAVALRASHDYTISQNQQGSGSGSSGSITSKREGDQAVTFANNASNISGDDYLKLTNYGLELISIQRGTIARIRNTGDNRDVTVLCCIT